MSRRYQTLFCGSSAGVNRPRVSGQRTMPTMSTLPFGAPSRAARRILAVERHEAAVDDDDAAAGKPRRREHPIAGPRHVGAEGGAGGIDQRLLPGQEFGREADARELLALLQQMRPAVARRQIGGRARKPRRHGRNQIFLPDLAVELPVSRGRREWRCRQWRRSSAPGCRAARRSHAASLVETAFRRLVMVLQRDQQALDQAAAAPASPAGSAAARAPHAPNRAADREPR